MDLLSGTLLSFLAGLLTPTGAVCVLPLYPGYLVYLAGKAGENDNRKKFFTFSLVVIAGIIFSLFCTGFVVIYLLRESVNAVAGIVSMAAFTILALVSMMLIAGFNFGRYLPSPGIIHTGSAYMEAFIFGMFFGLIILPCNPAPIILLFAISTTAISYLENSIFLVAFSLGLAIPIIGLSLIPAVSSGHFIRLLTGHRRAIQFFCGVFMLIISLYYLIMMFDAPGLFSSLLFSLPA
jgi:cytochrome c-type biogenesis protein